MTKAKLINRSIALEGGSNLRDLGGLIGLGGRKIKSGRLFRSGELFDLTVADADFLRKLGIAVVYDLRSTVERQRRPSEAHLLGEVQTVTRDYLDSAAGFSILTEKSDISTNDAKNAMRDLYRNIPFEHAESVRGIFDILINNNIPLLFHCVAGKDRTGIISAIILNILGCSRDQILEDYLISEQHIDLIRTRFLEFSSKPNIPDRIWEPVIHSDVSYIDAMFEHLDNSCGGVEGYLNLRCTALNDYA